MEDDNDELAVDADVAVPPRVKVPSLHEGSVACGSDPGSPSSALPGRDPSNNVPVEDDRAVDDVPGLRMTRAS